MILIFSLATAFASESNNSTSIHLKSAADIGSRATEVKGPADEAAIQIVGSDKSNSTTEIMSIENPQIDTHIYVIRGRVKHDDVAGNGFLELWNEFGEKGSYFSRGLAEAGPMKLLSGTNGWRNFELPFRAEPGMKPTRLRLNVVLPGKGTVTIAGPLKLDSIDALSTRPAEKFQFQPLTEIGADAKAAKDDKGHPAIELTGKSDTRTTAELIVCVNPEIGSHEYIVRGKLKYDDVSGDGYLELWNEFGSQGEYFSRTLGDSGPMGKLSGSSDWREFALPFYAKEGMKPQRLRLNLTLPGKGTVLISEEISLQPINPAPKTENKAPPKADAKGEINGDVDKGKLQFLPIAKIQSSAREVKETAGPNGEPGIEILSTEPSMNSTQVLVCKNPATPSHQYMLRGRVKYEDVSGDAYLEMWSNFGDKGEFFSRSLSPGGPMGKLTGTSDWREFSLPFFAESGMKPVRITLNVVLPGKGRVWIAGPLSLEATSWTTALVGDSGLGWVGISCWVVFAAVGGLSTLVLRYTKSRQVAVATVSTIGIVALGLLIAGVVGWLRGMSYSAYYPMALVGMVVLIQTAFQGRNIIHNVSQRIEAEELRRMNAIDTIRC